MSNDQITFEEFSKLEIRVGTVITAERIEGSSKLMRLVINLGNENRQIVAGIGKYITPENILNKQIPIAANIVPTKLMGVESNGMILAVDGEGVVLLHPEKPVADGSRVL